MAEIEKLYSSEEMANILGVTKQTIYNYIKRGKLKATKIGRDYKAKESILKEFIEKGHN